MAVSRGDKQIINTKWGEIFINGEKIQELKSAEIKVSNEYIDVEVANDMAKYRKFSGVEISGTIVINKVNSKFNKIISDMIKNRYAPEVNVQAILSDNAFNGSEVVALYGVTFDEIMLSKIGGNEGFEVELPFKANTFELLETME